ncbi:TetR/AcrR family transcriptional regulator [Streptomyces pactum]|uniref:TetR/AcrR family transcriptional regulator n=1 Tax=Streptomyces pactum TaxID=68249 RepID=UPI0036FF269C
MSPRRPAVLRDGGSTQDLRAHLIGTAARLIAEEGTARLTVRAIARAAGVADGVLYNHFADKEELLAHALRAHVRSVESGLGDLPDPGTGTVAGNLRRHIRHGLALHRAILPALAGLLAQPRVLIGFAGSAEPGGEWQDRLTRYLLAERDLGRLAPDAEVEAAAAMIVGVCHETVLSTLFGTPRPAGSPSPGPSAGPEPAPAETAQRAQVEQQPETAEQAARVDALVRAVLRGIGHAGHPGPAGPA